MRILLFTITLTLLTLSSQAQLLWKVSGNGLEKDSYILGSAHIAPPSLIDEIPGLNDAIKNCDLAIGEVVKSDRDDMDKYLMFAPPDSTLDVLLSPEDYQIVEAVVNKRFESHPGVTLDRLRMLKPNVLAYLLDILEVTELEEIEELFDYAVLERAAEAGHETTGFETPEAHNAIFFDCSLTDQAAWLLKQCKDCDEQGIDEGVDIYEAYLRQDSIELFEETAEDESEEKRLDIFLYARNRNWIADLVPMMSTGISCLVVVGIGHLPGEKGLLQLLRNQGFTVTPVTAE